MENFNGVKIYDWTPKESDCEKQGRYNPKVKERRKKKICTLIQIFKKKKE